MAIVQCEVYARVIDNEPTFYQHISIQLIPDNHILKLVKKEVSFQTKYILKLKDPCKLYPSISNAGTERAFSNVVLAINLLLERVALSRRPLYPYSEPQIIQDEPASKDLNSYNNVEIRQSTDPGDSSVSSSVMAVGESVSITDAVYISLSKEAIDLWEEKVLRASQLIDQLGNGTLQPAIARESHNLTESLNDFERAMNHPNLPDIFMSLFMAFEKAINCQKEVQGKGFDNVAAVLTGSPTASVKELRQAYDRFKHSDKTPKQVQKTLEYTKELPRLIRTLRPLAGRAILSRLKLTRGNP